MPATSEFTRKAGFLHLLFEYAKGKIYVVMFYLDDKHGFTSAAPVLDALPAVWQGSR